MGACSSSESDSDNPADIINALLRPGANVSNTAGLLDIQVKIKKKIESRSIQGNTNVISKQNIEIRDVGDGELDEFFKRTVDETKGPFGLLGKAKNCPIFACNYDIDQRSNYKIHSFNDSLLEETENILQDIEQKMKQDASVNLESNPSGLRAANEAINESRDYVRSEIQSYLSSISNQNAVNLQNIVIEYRNPIRCKDPCGLEDGPEGPKLSQNAQLDILSEQMLSSISNIYHKKFKESGIDVDQSIEATNTACILQMAIGLIGCIICLIIVWQIIKMMGA
tara:strand:- start:5752 stop:6597 length:846 start_codon:yes stop_codon:yes gene_type:complete